MRFRNIFTLAAVAWILLFFAPGSFAGEGTQNLYAQAQAPAPPQGQVQGQAPSQGQNPGQVNDKVRQLQEQYKDLLKHEYNPSNFHPKATGEPSFNKPGWLNHSKHGSGKKYPDHTANTAPMPKNITGEKGAANPGCTDIRRKGRESIPLRGENRLEAANLPGAVPINARGLLPQSIPPPKNRGRSRPEAQRLPHTVRVSTLRPLPKGPLHPNIGWPKNPDLRVYRPGRTLKAFDRPPKRLQKATTPQGLPIRERVA